jgi:PAS domain S-box-containing protein
LQAKYASLKNRYEIVGKTNYDMPWRDQADALNSINNKVMSTGKEYSVEEVTKQVDGTELTFLSKKIPLLDDKANIVEVLGISLDITKQKEAEQKLLEEKEKTDVALENIIAHLPGNVYWLDRNNVYLGCNMVQAKSAGLKDRHEIIGKTNYDMPWRDQAETFNMVNNEVMRTRKEYSVEEVAKQADGTEGIFISKKVPLLDSKDNIIGSLGISFDITKQKEAEEKLIEAKEQAEAANESKDEFLDNMRHDFRTPFAALEGLSGFMATHETDPTKKEYLGYICQSAHLLLEQLNEIMEFINSEEGKVPVLHKPFILEDAINKAIFPLKLPAEQKQVQLSE